MLQLPSEPQLFVCFYVSVCVFSGGWRGFQQPGGGAGGDHILVGGVGQVDSLHSYLWRGGDDTGETLPQTEVSQSAHTHKVKVGVLIKRQCD